MFKTKFDAAGFLEKGIYTNNHGKRDDHGIFQDEIVPIDDMTVWFYHGNPIALYDRRTGERLFSTCGWNTMTTKTRLNRLPGVHVYSQKGEVKGIEDSYSEITKRIGHKLYERIDGWRGYQIPVFAVLGASDTGMWSDSPCPSTTAEEEVKDARAYLRHNGITSYEAFGETSNCFCMKRWTIVRGNQYKDAMRVLEAYDLQNKHLLHKAS